MQKKLTIIGGQAAIILAAALFIYSPVFHGGWLMDDNIEVASNAVVQDPAGLPKIWHGDAGADYLPLKFTVVWFLWQAFGANPVAYHLTSIALHVLSALLLWRLLHRLGLRQAWVGGLLFAVHPIEVESVAWISELKNTLSLVFLLLTMEAWLSFDQRRRWPSYAGALLLFVAALLCKASVIMWPAVILLYAWWRRGRIGWGDVAASLPFFAVSLAAGVATVWLQQQRAIGTAVYPLGGLASRIALSGMNVAFYLSKIVFPVGLLPMYPRWRIDPPDAFEFLPWPILAALCVFCWTRRRTAWGRAVLFGLGFFIITLLPVLGFFKMSFMRIAWASDHLVYLPSLGILGLAAGGFGAMYDRLGKARRRYALAAGGLVLVLLVFTSHQYAQVYSSMEAMSRYTLQSNPDAWLAHQLYAVSAQQKGDFDTALVQATAAVGLKPDVPETQNALGLALEAKGNLPDAIAHLEAGIRLRPKNVVLHINLARCLVKAGRFEAALREYSTLQQLAPDNAIYPCDMGVCLYKLGRLDEAIAEFRQALAMDPNLRPVREYLALALKEKNEHSGAERSSP
jgi:tetratricopeptide (TPR) repeat protein